MSESYDRSCTHATLTSDQSVGQGTCTAIMFRRTIIDQHCVYNGDIRHASDGDDATGVQIGEEAVCDSRDRYTTYGNDTITVRATYIESPTTDISVCCVVWVWRMIDDAWWVCTIAKCWMFNNGILYISQ